MKDIVDYSKKSQGNDQWSKLKDFKDPVTGKVVPQTPEGEPSPVGTGLNKPSDSNG
jgi:hypothetical protein